MRALSVRQPYAELIPRGTCGRQIKPVEFRSRPTTVVGERFYVYASRQSAKGKLYLEGCRPLVGKPEEPVVRGPLSVVRKAWSGDLALPGANAVEPWMLELARMLILNDLPTGVIVGSAVIEKVSRGTSFYEGHLADIERAKRLRKPRGHPQPVWFKPF